MMLLPETGRGQAALADTYRQKAEIQYANAKYEQAIVWYKKAYALVRHSDPVRAANLCVDLASMDYMKSQTRQAADRCLVGLRFINGLPSAPDSVRFKLYSSLGTYYKALYRKDSAFVYFRKADALLTHNPAIEQQIPLYVLYHFNNQGNWFFGMGNYSKSLSYLAKAREEAITRGFIPDVTYIESNLAGCYDAIGNSDEALRHRLLADKFHHQNDIRKCGNLSGIAWTLYKHKRYVESLHYFREAQRLLTTLRRGKKPTDYLSDQIHLWRMMSSCYQATNQLLAADRLITQALRLHRQYIGSQGALLAQVLVAKGELCEVQHQPEQALNAYQAAMRAVCRDTSGLTANWQNPSVEIITDETTLLLAAAHKAAILKKNYDTTGKNAYLNASIDTYRFCVILQQHIRHGIDTDQSQIIFSTRQHTVVSEAVAATFDAYQLRRTVALRETLFQFFEQAQAGSLREAFRLNAIKPQTIPATLLEREQRLKQRIANLKKRSASDSVANLELTACQLQWHQLIDTFRQDYPAYYRLNYQDISINTQTLQQKLDQKTAYVAYVRQGSSLFILVATRQTLEVVRQPIDSVRFEQQLVNLKRQLYEDPVLGRYNGTEQAAGLYAVCIEPIRKYISGKTRLIISRDWSFNFLPFEVLETGQQAHDYLARHVAMAYAFSAQSFFEASQRPVSTSPILVVAPFARADALQQAVNRQEVGQTLASSETEARSIGGEVLVGSSASLPAFLKKDLHRNVIYFATHAKTNDADPSNSYIAFYPGEEDKLYTDDIYNLPLTQTGLVVLGACEGGSGHASKGEGILSLARAFAYAGCPAVVTTLWKANDETTSFLTIRLHQYLSRGMPVDLALQQARLDFFESPLVHKYNHPYYWANYTLLGNYNPVMAGHDQLVSTWWLVGVGLLGLLGFWQRNRLIRFVKNQ